MPDRHSKNAAPDIISTTFVSLLAVPAVGPALSAVQIEFGIQNRDIGWMLMSSYTLPALLLVPVTGYLADRFGKKLILFPSLVIFGLCGGLVSLASNIETLICLRFIQGIGGSALVILSTALIPDLFSGSDRIKIMGCVGATQGIGSGLLPLVGGLLASITWFFPFMTALIALPVGIYMLSTLQSLESDLNPKNKHYLYHAWTHLADRRVIELCFFTFGFIFVGFGCFVSYIPSFMNYSFGSGPALIGVIISARAITGALTSVFLVQAMQLFSSRALIVSSFTILATGMASLPVVTGPLGILFSALCYGAGFGVIRPLIQVHLFEIAPKDLRATFSSANGMALRLAQTLSPFVAGLMIASFDFDILYYCASSFASVMAILALAGKSLRPSHKPVF